MIKTQPRFDRNRLISVVDQTSRGCQVACID